MSSFAHIRMVIGTTLLLGMLTSCSEDLVINAPYQDIWVVYGVLNSEDSTQYVRVSKAYQVEGDALEYANANDPSLSGLNVTLEGGGKTWNAIETIGQRAGDGDFPEEMKLYRFDTFDNDALKTSVRYTLRITSDSLEGFQLLAQTLMPPKPKISSPEITTLSFTNYCLPFVPFEDSAQVIFQKNADLFSSKNQAMRFEVRVRLDFTENGNPRQLIYHPARLLSHSTGCNPGTNFNLCYQFDGGRVIDFFASKLPSETANYAYKAQPHCEQAPAYLAKSIAIEVAAIDTILSKYILINDPRLFNLNTVRPEFSNVSGTERAIGILGSIATDDVPVALTECATYLLRLNGVTQRPRDCE